MPISVDLPQAPANPPVIVSPVQQQNPPASPPQYSTSSSDLALTGNQNNTNSSQSVANIRNSAIYNSTITGANISVGDISIQTTSVAIQANYNPQYGDTNINAQIVMPLGQSKERKSVRKILANRERASLGALAVSIKNNCLTMEQVKALYPDSPELLVFAIDRPSVTAYEASRCMHPLPEAQPDKIAQQQAEIDRLKQEIAVLQAMAKARVPQEPMQKQVPVQGLW